MKKLGTNVLRIVSSERKKCKNVRTVIFWGSFPLWYLDHAFELSPTLAVRSHQFSVEITNFNQMFYSNSFLSSNYGLWNTPVFLQLQKFKRNRKCHFLSLGISFFLLSFLLSKVFSFSLTLFHSQQFACFFVALSLWVENDRIGVKMIALRWNAKKFLNVVCHNFYSTWSVKIFHWMKQFNLICLRAFHEANKTSLMW